MEAKKTKGRTTKSTKPKTLLGALSKFQQEVPILTESSKGYSYSYVDLAEIVRVITPLLAKHGLGYVQPLENNGIRTVIFHVETGDKLESYCDIPFAEMKGMNTYQSYGSAITYFRRYALSSILGLVSEKDVDANIETKVKSKVQVKKSLTNIRFNDALKSINEGAYTKEELIEQFKLTKEQLKTVENGNTI
tara:strand:- start:24 stop:599 length:576 start_codon:yes stop_codon:yes gene_type:complete